MKRISNGVNHTYGTFLTKKNGFLKTTRQRAALIVLAVVFIGGPIGAVYKGIDSLRHKKQAAVVETPVLSEIPGWWLQQYFGASVCGKEICRPEHDLDEDKLTNVQEFYYHTNPTNAYTAGDELDDGQLLALGFDPSKAGRVTFEEAILPENLLGESLVFDKDITKLVADANDIGKVALPVLKEDELDITYAETEEVYRTYASKLKDTMNEYFPQSNIQNIKEILKSGSDAQVNQVKVQSMGLSVELRTLKVPVRFLMFHKYNIMMFQLLSEIATAPTDMTSADSEIWYDKVQAFLAVQQKLSYEEQSLKLSSQIPQ